MARPSNKEQRREEILQAYEHCISLYGVEGATQQKIAEKAGIARPLLRHHIGNNDDLLIEVTRRFVRRCDAEMVYYESYEYASGEEFLQGLFYWPYEQDDHSYNDTMVASALLISAQSNDEVKKMMLWWFSNIRDSFKKTLKKLYPEQKDNLIDKVATGLIGIFFNADALFPLWEGQDIQDQSYAAAKLLLANLET